MARDYKRKSGIKYSLCKAYLALLDSSEGREWFTILEFERESRAVQRYNNRGSAIQYMLKNGWYRDEKGRFKPADEVLDWFEDKRNDYYFVQNMDILRLNSADFFNTMHLQYIIMTYCVCLIND